MIKRKVNLDDKRNIKLSLSCSKIESKIIENLSKELKTSKTEVIILACLLYTSPSPRDRTRSRMPSSA